MNSKVYSQAYERAQGKCEIEGCSTPYNMLSVHHIIFGQGRRAQCERIETVIVLCYGHHQQSPTGAHHNKRLNTELHTLASDRLKANGLQGEDLKKALGGRFY